MYLAWKKVFSLTQNKQTGKCKYAVHSVLIEINNQKKGKATVRIYDQS